MCLFPIKELRGIIGLVELFYNIIIAYGLNKVLNFVSMPENLSLEQQMICVICAMSGFMTYPSFIHYEYNKSLEKGDNKKINQNEDPWSNYLLGIKNIESFGCAPIACAQLFNELGVDYKFYDIVAYFERHTQGFGYLGTDSSSIIPFLNRYISANGYEAKKINFNSKEEYTTYDKFITLQFNSDGYTMHYEYVNDISDLDDLSSYVQIIRVSKKENISKRG